MEIILNNRKENIPNYESMTMQELIVYKNFTFKMLVTKINDNLVKKKDRNQSIIKDGDNIMVMHLISGG